MVALFLIWSCIDTIDLELPSNAAGRIVLEGYVYQTPDHYAFRASARKTVQILDELVFALDDSELTMVFNGMEVFSLENNVELLIDIDQFHSDFGGSPDESIFRLRALTSDGRILESTEQRVLLPAIGSSLEVGLDSRLILNDAGNIIDKEFVELFINSPLVNLRSQRVSYLWEVSGVYRYPELTWTDSPFWLPTICYIPVRPLLNAVNVVSSADVSSEELVRFKINEIEADFKFHSAFYYTVVLKAINAAAAEYWKEVGESIKRDGTLFDTPPGKIRTNLRNINDASDDQILGYFYAAGVDTLRYLAMPDATGFQRHQCNPLDSMDVPCCDCLAGFRNSSIEKPHYWD